MVLAGELALQVYGSTSYSINIRMSQWYLPENLPCKLNAFDIQSISNIVAMVLAGELALQG